ncbi:DUF362 domain-containing protein [Deferribacterales bacterium RsTz2092]|nr:hypothetical protein AGMMS49941_05560 [Deferribacterales bacterium]
MKRREFLKSSLSLGVALSLGRAEVALSADVPDLVVVKGEPVRATERAIDALGGIGRFVKPGQSVVIKPNMSFASGIDVAANTNPDVVATVVRLCKAAGAKKISVLDHTLAAAESCLELSGIRAACNKVVSNCVHAVGDKRFYSEVKIKGAQSLKTTSVMREVLEADVLIAVPKAKSHGGAGVSCTMKGNLGLIYDRGVFHFSSLHTCVADLYSLLVPAFSVVDATKVMTTNGPGGPGKVIDYGEIVASIDGVAADAYIASSYEWFGRRVKPENVGYLKEAAARGLGRIDIDAMRISRLNV